MLLWTLNIFHSLYHTITEFFTSLGFCPWLLELESYFVQWRKRITVFIKMRNQLYRGFEGFIRLYFHHLCGIQSSPIDAHSRTLLEKVSQPSWLCHQERQLHNVTSMLWPQLRAFCLHQKQSLLRKIRGKTPTYFSVAVVHLMWV